MKLTNFEISEKLHSLNLHYVNKGSADWVLGEYKQKKLFYRTHAGEASFNRHEYESYPAYNLDDILEVLNEVVKFSSLEKYGLPYAVEISPVALKVKTINDEFIGLVYRQSNENLADTASRLLIKLILEGMINIEVTNDGRKI